MRPRRFRLLSLSGSLSLLLLALAALFPMAYGAAADGPGAYAWIEGEAPASISPAAVKPNISGWGHKEFLSGDTWLQISLDPDQVEKQVPAEGVVLSYPFSVSQAGTYQVWDRLGYEFVRSPLEWRVDSGEWAKSGPDQLTSDLMELSEWTEVAWLQLGEQSLPAGAHRLEIRLPRTKDEKGKTARILYASDALCLTSGPFHPNGKWKPGQDWRTAADREAAQKSFRLPLAQGAPRTSISLDGPWEVARNDEQTPKAVDVPMRDFPSDPHWSAIPVPSDRNESRPDLLMAHRLWYRTRVQVPEGLSNRSFFLTFPLNNLNTTVYVNGQYCGFNRNPYCRWDCDVTKAVKPGVNEVWVGIRDAWYAYSTNPDNPVKLRKMFNLPLSFTSHGFQDLAYPVWNAFRSGILNTPVFSATGSAYATDVFCKPSVARKEMAADVTVANRSGQAVKGEVLCEALDAASGAVEKALPPAPFTVAADAEAMVNVAGPWADAKLWWPDEPHLYRLRTTVKLDGKAVDQSETTFGFREWGSRGKDFTLNGIVWHGWADLTQGNTPETWLANYRKTGQRFMRLMGAAQGGIRWNGLTTDQALDFFDRSGVPVRRCGPLDGEAIGYMAVENDPVLRKLYGTEIKQQLLDNWRQQMVAQVRGERNHPSIMLWSIENEWLFINTINLYGGLMDKFEAAEKVCADAVLATDPTRLCMSDGGGAGKANVLPVHGDHYVFSDNDTRYPDLAYQANPQGGGRGRWVWDQKRPRFLGEEFFANGINPADYAMFGGEPAFQGKVQARPAAGRIVRMLTEGYRWAEYGAWHLWLGPDDAVDQYGANSDLAVFCREWDWSFGSGEKVKRTFGIFNDTHHDDPVTFTWALMLGGKKVAGASTEHHVAAGRNEKFDRVIAMPVVTTRQEGQLVLTLTRGGHEAFRDVKPISLLPAGTVTAGTPVKRAKATTRPVSATKAAGTTARTLLVFDPAGTTAGFLKSRGVPFTALSTLSGLPESGRLLIIGKDALDPAESTSSRIAAWASSGRTVIVLEQKNPLKYQALPAEMDPAPTKHRSDFGQEEDISAGRIAFGEDLGHPVLRGLQQKDFFTWGPDEIVYRRPYNKPARGGKSLVQCGPRLTQTALAEVPAGKGMLLISQLAIEEKLATSPVARQLLANMIDYGARYRLEYRQVAAAVKDDPALAKVLDEIGLKYTAAEGPLAAVNSPTAQLAIVAATPANLKLMADNHAAVEKFEARGGYLLLHGLTPEGLADYDRLVGFAHMIRPFRRERVTFPVVKSSLTSGLTLGDIVMLSGERIFPWTSDEYVASDIFRYVIDYDDVAPFAKFPSDFLLNMVNGMVSADAWKYIVNVPVPKSGPLEWKLELPKEEEIAKVEWIGNTFYYPVTKAQLLFDGNPASAFTMATKPNNDPQEFEVTPARKGREITLRLAEWETVPGKAAVTGLDNIRIFAKRSPEFYRNVKPLLNVGGLMEYPKGPGGIVLCNLLFQDRESVPANAVKKRTIMATMLRNLKAPFSAGNAVIAGAKLQYAPVDISKQATQYRDEKGWFGDRRFTFAGMPAGHQVFAGVPFEVYDFPTSPVPTVLMLKGQGIPGSLPDRITGIPVNRRADALFFLQAARLDRRMDDRERREKKQFELARYVVTYADGQKAEVPVYSEIDVDDYHQPQPVPLPGAQVAWSKPYEGAGQSAVAYTQQWNNPRPDVEIRSIDLLPGKDNRGTLALIAVTAASQPR